MVSGVVEQLAAGLGRQIQPTFGYYRQPNGWITVSPATQMERMKYIDSGWQHLAQYGSFDMTPYVATHPFEGLFMFGGVHEMSAEQVLQTGLYIDPPLVPTCRQHITQFHRSHTGACWVGAQKVSFPQMDQLPEGVKGPFPCGFCPRLLPTREACTQHQRVAHKEELGRVQVGQTMGDSLAAALANKPSNPVIDEGNSAVLLNRIEQLEKQVKKNTKRGVTRKKRKSLPR